MKKTKLKDWKNSYARNNIEAYRKYQREYRRKRRIEDLEFRERIQSHTSKYKSTIRGEAPVEYTKELFEAITTAKTCQICSTPFQSRSDANIDHDYSTGNFRGILCRSCNIGLGLFYDNTELLEKAKVYLESQEKL